MFTELDDVNPDYEYLAIDPGETSGWCTFNAKGGIVQFGQFSMHEQNNAIKTLIKSGLKKVIIEDYKNHAWKRQTNWSRNQTSKNIGKLELACDMFDVEYFLQSNTCLNMGFMYLGMEMPKNHSISHQFCAMAHGVYWLQNNGIRPVGAAMRQDEK